MRLRVPRWVLEKTSYGEGRRLAPITKFKAETQHPMYHSKVKEGMTNLASARHKLILEDQFLKFKNWEYRFWCPENDGDMVCGATCRQCGSVFAGDEKERFNHNKNNGCYNKLVKAYTLLLQDRNCVMCDTDTHNSDFGVPLCKTGTCKDEWMHETSTPKALDAAIKIVARREADAKAEWEREKANGPKGRETQVN